MNQTPLQPPIRMAVALSERNNSGQSAQNGQCLSRKSPQYGPISSDRHVRHGHYGLVTQEVPAWCAAGRDQALTGNVISSAILKPGLVTVTVEPPKCPAGGPWPPSAHNGETWSSDFIPGNAGSVLIAGLSRARREKNFFMAFQVRVASSSTFT